MFDETTIVRRRPVDTVTKGYEDKKLTPGIMHRVCDVVDVAEGVLDPHPDFYTTRMFHKKVDRLKEVTALRIIGLIAPDIMVPYVIDSGSHIDGVDHEGCYMRYIKGVVLKYRKQWTTQHKFDLGCMGTFDALVGNGDRHSQNAMVTPRHVYPIDHGSTFYGTLQERIGSAVFTLDKSDPSMRAGVEFALDNIYRYASEIAELMSVIKLTLACDVKDWALMHQRKLRVEYAA